MRKDALYFLLVVLLATVLVGTTASAVNVVGTKFYDYNKDGIAGSNSFPLQGWTIQARYLNGTAVAGAQDVTDADGLYAISGLDPYFDYYVCEILQSGWENTTPVCQKVGFDLCSGVNGDSVYEFFTDQAKLIVYMPNLPDLDSNVLLGWNARIGNAVSNPPSEEEMKIFYPLGQWSGGQSSTGLSNGGDVSWVNNTFVPFNATWIPGVTLYQDAMWTVNGVTVTQNSTHPRSNAVPIRDIVIRLHAEKNTGYTVELNNLVLKQGIHTYPLTNSPLTFHYIDPQNEDLYLVIRASDILTSLGGSDIGSGGFSLTGNIRFSWPAGTSPNGNDIKTDIMVGRYNCSYLNVANVNFGNHINGSISGYKLDSNGNPLSGWNISATNVTRNEFYFDLTNVDGYYNISNIPLGYYWLNETLMDGYSQLTPNRTVQINVTTLDLMNQNFTNRAEVFCIDGYKYDGPTGTVGLAGWNITVRNVTGAPVGSAVTNATGYWQVCGVLNGTYEVCEVLQPGYMNLTPLCQNVTIAGMNQTATPFRNQLRTFCIDGYKIDNCTGQGISSWNISVKNETAVVVANSTSNQFGYYKVCGLLPGNYTVCEELKTGWTNITALCRYANITDSNVTNVNFTNTRLFCIEGRKTNGTTNEGLANWNIIVKNAVGQEVGKATTTASGNYKVCGLSPGIYTVCEELQSGWINVTPTCVDVNITCSNATVDFSNIRLVQNGSISGYKINQSCDCTISGWTIRLYNATSGGLVTLTKTDATGKYSFTGLKFGSYWVNESPQEAWAAVSPPHVQVNISVQSPYATNINFTNYRSFTCNSSDVITVNGVEKHLVCIWDP